MTICATWIVWKVHFQTTDNVNPATPDVKPALRSTPAPDVLPECTSELMDIAIRTAWTQLMLTLVLVDANLVLKIVWIASPLQAHVPVAVTASTYREAPARLVILPALPASPALPAWVAQQMDTSKLANFAISPALMDSSTMLSMESKHVHYVIWIAELVDQRKMNA